MVHGLAVQLHGSLRLSSEEGKAALAELWLPVIRLVAADPADPAPAAAAPEPPSRMKILVVDDDVLISMATIDMLEDLGHEALEVSSGARALEILGSGGAFDLMIIDYAMPRMTGVELARKVRALRPEMPILLATGYAELPAGAEADLRRLPKPYGQEQLAAEIAGVAKARPA
jgi:CheY-like chemotaxis protein